MPERNADDLVAGAFQSTETNISVNAVPGYDEKRRSFLTATHTKKARTGESTVFEDTSARIFFDVEHSEQEVRELQKLLPD